MRTGDSLPFQNDTDPPPPPTVLVAEDDREMRTLLVGALRRAGFRVVEAADGQQLRDRALDPVAGPPDAIVTDHRMPRMTGIDALALIRRQYPELPAIVTTAFGESETHEQARALNARVLDKPFDLDELLAMVRDILNLQAA